MTCLVLTVFACTLCNAAGDGLFRVVERTSLPDGPQGSKRVEVVNKAAIRVLAWKLWSTSNVIYEIEPSTGKTEAAAAVQQQALMPFAASSNAEQRGEHVTFDLVSSVSSSSSRCSWPAYASLKETKHALLPQASPVPGA